MQWRKTNKESENEISEGDALLPLVRTMEDDLAGRNTPPKVVAPAEPLVSFDPNATMGAPFYAAKPAISEEEPKKLPETSPFFQNGKSSTSEVSEKKTERVEAAPPAGLPVLPHESVPLESPRAEDVVSPVPLRVGSPVSGSSFQGIIPKDGPKLGRFSQFHSSEKLKWIFLASAVVVIIAIGAGGYFWNMKEDKALSLDKAPVPKQETSQTAPVSQTETTILGKYQADQPNILSFDTETVTAEEIKSTLLQAGQGIKKENIAGAVEFLVRDQKLNPLALSRFAYLAKMNLPGEILETLDEPFSLYLVIDQGRPRVVLLSYAKDEATLKTTLQIHEKSLGTALDPFFLDMTTAQKGNLVFRDGSYLDRPVRFSNVDETFGLSVDYAVRGKQWILGTSKDSLRAVLDKTGQ